MTYDRAYNEMSNYLDESARITYSDSGMSNDFIAYVNEDDRNVKSKGATLLYAFTPVNGLSVEQGTTTEQIAEWYERLSASLECDLLGSPYDYIMDYDWFYDSNVHLNSAGAVAYTRQLAKDLKVMMGDSGAINIEIPQKPTIPEDESQEKDESDAMFFEYEARGTGLQIVGLTSDGKTKRTLTIPTSSGGSAVVGFNADTFAGNTVIEELRFLGNIRSIADGSFAGCSNLKRLYVPVDTLPSRCAVYSGLLNGANNCKIYVPTAKLGDYITDYFWSRYSGRMVGY